MKRERGKNETKKTKEKKKILTASIHRDQIPKQW